MFFYFILVTKKKKYYTVKNLHNKNLHCVCVFYIIVYVNNHVFFLYSLFIFFNITILYIYRFFTFFTIFYIVYIIYLFTKCYLQVLIGVVCVSQVDLILGSQFLPALATVDRENGEPVARVGVLQCRRCNASFLQVCACVCVYEWVCMCVWMGVCMVQYKLSVGMCVYVCRCKWVCGCIYTIHSQLTTPADLIWPDLPWPLLW